MIIDCIFNFLPVNDSSSSSTGSSLVEYAGALWHLYIGALEILLLAYLLSGWNVGLVIGRSLVRIAVHSPPGSDPGRIVHTHTPAQWKWRLNSWHLWYRRITVLSQLFTHGAQVNSAFQASGVDKWGPAIRWDKGLKITSVGCLCDPMWQYSDLNSALEVR